MKFSKKFGHFERHFFAFEVGRWLYLFGSAEAKYEPFLWFYVRAAFWSMKIYEKTDYPITFPLFPKSTIIVFFYLDNTSSWFLWIFGFQKLFRICEIKMTFSRIFGNYFGSFFDIKRVLGHRFESPDQY